MKVFNHQTQPKLIDERFVLFEYRFGACGAYIISRVVCSSVVNAGNDVF